MGWIIRGNEDVNIVGVVGSTRSNEDDEEPKTENPKMDDTNTTIKHYGRGSVNINGRRVR